MARRTIRLDIEELALPADIGLDTADLQARVARELTARWQARAAGTALDSLSHDSAAVGGGPSGGLADGEDAASAMTRRIADRVWRTIDVGVGGRGRR